MNKHNLTTCHQLSFITFHDVMFCHNNYAYMFALDLEGIHAQHTFPTGKQKYILYIFTMHNLNYVAIHGASFLHFMRLG